MALKSIRLIFVLSIFIIASIGGAFADNVKIGSLSAVTGPIAKLVPPIINGSKLAIKQINAQGGVLGGKKLELIVGDTGCNAQASVDAATKLVNVEQVVAIVGALCSGATIGAANNVAIPSNVVMVSPASTSPEITGLKDNDLIFRVAPTDAYQGKVLAKYVKDGSIDASSALDGTVLLDGTEAEFLASGAFISDFSESWSLEADETGAETLDGGYLKPRTYKISHSMSATGKTHYTPEGKKLRACDQAKKFVHDTLDLAPNNDKIFNYPNSANTSLNPDGDPTSYSNRLPTAIGGLIGSGTLDLISKYGGFNRLVSEDIDETNGSYSINETWLLASGTAYETYNMTVNSSMDSPFREVSINGTITGLSSVSPSGFGGSVESAGYPRDYGTKTRTSATPTDRFGDLPDRHPRSPRDLDGTYINTAYDNAASKWRAVSGNETLGIGSEIYKRANYQITNDLDGYRKLNPQYMSVSLAANEVDGTISYNVTYNNRPLNVLSGVLYENISISDTNPGDVFSVIPVIGRRTGPVLQYIGGRTEYKRDVSIEILVSREDRFWGDPTYDNISNVGTGFGVYSSANPHLGNYLNANLTATGRALLPAKPSIVEPTRTQLQQLLMELSPVSEPGIRKYFVNAPTESWDPKEGRYTLNVSWTYELEV